MAFFFLIENTVDSIWEELCADELTEAEALLKEWFYPAFITKRKWIECMLSKHITHAFMTSKTSEKLTSSACSGHLDA